MGIVHLKWAFSEAAVLFLRHAEGRKLIARIRKQHGKGKALSILAHKYRQGGVLHAVAKDRLLDGQVPRGVARKGAGEPDA
jgi:hypothetical protein